MTFFKPMAVKIAIDTARMFAGTMLGLGLSSLRKAGNDKLSNRRAQFFQPPRQGEKPPQLEPESKAKTLYAPAVNESKTNKPKIHYRPFKH